jgi:hypothetical protein
MTDIMPAGDAKALPKAIDKGKPNSEKPPLGEDGAALSQPQAARLVNVTFQVNDASLTGFPSQHRLLQGFESANASTETADHKGPEFPLNVPYDPEQAYRTADGKPTQRGEQLQQEAKNLLQSVAKPDGSLSLVDHGKIMDEIAQNKDLSEADKWYLYKQVCNEERKGRNKDGGLIPGTQATRVLFDAAKPTGLPESGKGDVVRHIIIDPTNDGYHGGLVYNGGSWRSGYMQGQWGIHFHEDIEKPIVNLFRGQGIGVDDGDEQASYRQLRALRAMQSGGFNAYSKAWNEGFAK